MSSIFLASQNDLSNAKGKPDVLKATKIMFTASRNKRGSDTLYFTIITKHFFS